MNTELLRKRTEETCLQNFGTSLSDASNIEAYRSVCIAVRKLLVEKNHEFRKGIKEDKKVYYMSMEFLVGTSLRNNLFNLGIEDQMKEILSDAVEAERDRKRVSVREFMADMDDGADVDADSMDDDIHE